jgi:hypothetical protein
MRSGVPSLTPTAWFKHSKTNDIAKYLYIYHGCNDYWVMITEKKSTHDIMGRIQIHNLINSACNGIGFPKQPLKNILAILFKFCYDYWKWSG